MAIPLRAGLTDALLAYGKGNCVRDLDGGCLRFMAQRGVLGFLNVVISSVRKSTRGRARVGARDIDEQRYRENHCVLGTYVIGLLLRRGHHGLK